MKKLLGILSSIALLSSSSAIVVSCGSNPYDKKTADGDTILIDLSNGINFNGKGEIDANDILNEMLNNGLQQRSWLMQELMQLLNVSFLSVASQDAKDGENDLWDKSSPYFVEGILENLKTKFTDLISNIKKDIKNEKDDYIDNKKHGEDEWFKMLKDKFPGFSDHGLLEQKYLQYKLMNDTNNVTSTLLNVLLNTDQNGVKWVDLSELPPLLSAAKGYKLDELTDGSTQAKTLVQIYNSTQTDYKNMLSYNKKEDIKKAFDGIQKIQKSDIKNEIPEDIDKLTSGGNDTRKGFLSNSQRYFLEKFYNMQAPLAISEITVGFGIEGKYDDGITPEDFKGDNTKAINDFLKDLPKGKDARGFWDGLMTSPGALQDYNGMTSKNYSSLLTLSNSTDFSQMLRNTVYDFTLNGKKNTSKDVDASTLTGLIPAINRETGKMYTVINEDEGILAFVDTDGLHFVRIDGYRFLKDNGAKNTSIPTTNGRIDSKNYDELKAFKKFYDYSNGTLQDQRVAEIQRDTDVNSNLFNTLNTSVKTPYLHYLVNQSLLKGVKGSATTFDVMTDLKNYVKIEKPGDDGEYTWWTAILDYFRVISNKESQADVNKFLDHFITFNTGDKSRKIDVPSTNKSIKDFFEEELVTIWSALSSDPITSFQMKAKSAADDISKNTSTTYPKGVFDFKDFNYFKSRHDNYNSTSEGSSNGGNNGGSTNPPVQETPNLDALKEEIKNAKNITQGKKSDDAFAELQTAIKTASNVTDESAAANALLALKDAVDKFNSSPDEETNPTPPSDGEKNEFEYMFNLFTKFGGIL